MSLLQSSLQTHTHIHTQSLLCISGCLFKDSLDRAADFQSLLPKSSGDSGQFAVSVSAYCVGWAVFISSSLQFYHTMHNGMAKLAFFFSTTSPNTNHCNIPGHHIVRIYEKNNH